MRWGMGAWRLLVGGVLTLLYTGPQWGPHVFAVVPSVSLAPGFYLRMWPGRALQIWDAVVLTAPESLRPYMPTDLAVRRVLKRIAALPGMTVCWDETAMWVASGGAVRVAYAYHAEAPAVRMPCGCRVLHDRELVIVGTHARSFDSRYVGPVDAALVQWRAWPLWTWEGS